MTDLNEFDTDLDFDLSDEADDRRRFRWVLVGFTVAGLLGTMLCAGGVWLTWTRIGEIPVIGDFAPAELPPPVYETSEERRLWAQAAFADPPPFEVDRRPIDALFRQIKSACTAGDHAAFRRLVDGERYWQSMKESGLITRLTRGEDRAYPAAILATLEVPAAFSEIHVQSVTSGPQPDEAVAYVIAWEDDWIWEMRWWLVKRGSAWRVFDWEWLQFSMRYSRRHAAFVAENEEVRSYGMAINSIEAADTAVSENRFLDAARELQKAASKSVPEPFAAEHRLDVAFGWARAGLRLFEMRAYRQASSDSLSRAPGLLLGWAIEAQAAGDFEHSLELMDRFEQAVGGGPNVDRGRGDALFALGRYQEAADAYERLLAYRPDDLGLLNDLAHRLPAERFDVLFTATQQQADPIAACLSLAAAVSERSDALARIESHLSELQAKSGEALLVRGDRLAADGAFDRAAEAYVKAFERLPPPLEEADEETQPARTADDAIDRLVWMLCPAGRVIQAYELAPDKRRVFEEILWYADEYSLPDDEFATIVSRHLEAYPDEPAALAQAARIAAESGDQERAVELILKSAERGPEHVNGYQTVSTLIQAGRVDHATEYVRRHRDDGGAFQPLADHLAREMHWERLLELAREFKPEDGYGRSRITVHRARALAALDRYAEAEELLAKAYEEIEEEWIKSSLLTEWYDLATENKQPPERIAELVGANVLKQFATIAVLEGDLEKAAMFEQLWRRGGDSALDILASTTGRLWQAQDYAGLVTAVRGVSLDAALAEEFGGNVADRYTRSLIRLGRTKEAKAAALRAYIGTGDATVLTVACLADSDWEGASEAARVLDDFARSRLFDDEDAAQILRAPEAAAFRQNLRREAFDLSARTRAVLLLGGANETEIGELSRQLRNELAAAGMDATVEPVELQSTEPVKHLLIRADDQSWIASFGSGRYVHADDLLNLKNKELHQPLSRQSSWIAVDELQGVGRTQAAVEKLVTTLAVNASKRELLAMYWSGDQGDFLLPWTSDLLDSLRQPGFNATELESAEPFGLSRLYQSDAAEGRPGFESSLRVFAEAFAKRASGDPFVVDAELFLPHGKISLKLDVERVISHPYLIEAVGTIDSKQIPTGLAEAFDLREGDLFAVSGPQLRSWSFSTRGQTVRAEDHLPHAE